LRSCACAWTAFSTDSSRTRRLRGGAEIDAQRVEHRVPRDGGPRRRKALGHEQRRELMERPARRLLPVQNRLGLSSETERLRIRHQPRKFERHRLVVEVEWLVVQVFHHPQRWAVAVSSR
jgi:hypothetical protein